MYMIVNYSCNQCGYYRQVESELLHECETARSPRGDCLQKINFAWVVWGVLTWSEMVPVRVRWSQMGWDGPMWTSEASLESPGRLFKGIWRYWEALNALKALIDIWNALEGPWSAKTLLTRQQKPSHRNAEWPTAKMLLTRGTELLVSFVKTLCFCNDPTNFYKVVSMMSHLIKWW